MPRDLVLWLLEQGYENEYFKLSVADQVEWYETVVPEAISIWRELLNSTTKSGIVQQIHMILDEYGLIADRTVVREQCSEYVANGDMNAAKEALINAIINDPNWEDSMDLLRNVLKIEANESHDQSLQGGDLKDH